MKGRAPTKRNMAVSGLLAGLTLGQVGLAAGQTGQINDPLLLVLIKKGILTADEALQVQAEAKVLEEADKQEMVKAVEEKGAGAPKGLKDLSIGMLAYVDYSTGQKSLANGKSDSFNQFSLTAGFAYETTDYEDDFGAKKGAKPFPGNKPGDDRKVQAVLQIKF